MKEECKRHKWRVGAGIGEIINKKIVTTKLNIWCERCDKVIKANYFGDYELKQMKYPSGIKKYSQKINNKKGRKK